MVDDGLIEFERLISELFGIMVEVRDGQKPWRAVQDVLYRIDLLQADTQTAAEILGLISPWLPELNDTSRKGPSQRPAELDLSIKALTDLVGKPRTGFSTEDDNRYPYLEDAVAWLAQKKVVTPDQFREMQARQQVAVFSAPGINNKRTLQNLRNAVSNSINEGDSLPQFRKRIEVEVSLGRAQQETLFRTETKRSFVEGMETTLAVPAIREQFPYVYYNSTRDRRTRPEHLLLDGIVVRRGTPEFEILKAAVEDWNCRCHFIPLSEKQAESYRIYELKDLPQAVLAKYRNAI